MAPEEIALAIQRVVAAAYGISQPDVPHETVRLLGFGRVTSEMRARIETIMHQMLADGILKQQGEQLMVSEQDSRSA